MAVARLEGELHGRNLTLDDWIVYDLLKWMLEVVRDE
jgi:hypothetical protein